MGKETVISDSVSNSTEGINKTTLRLETEENLIEENNETSNDNSSSKDQNCAELNTAENNVDNSSSREETNCTELKSAELNTAENSVDTGSSREETNCIELKSAELNTAENSVDNSSSREETNCTELKSTDSKDHEVKIKTPEFCIAPTNHQFKLRIVPIEKLLENPKAKENKEASSFDLSITNKVLPARSVRKNISIIELSDSEDDYDSDEVIVHRIKPQRQNNKTNLNTATEAKRQKKDDALVQRNTINQENSTTTKSTYTVTKIVDKDDDNEKREELIVKLKSTKRQNNTTTANFEHLIRKCVVRLKRTHYTAAVRRTSTTSKKTTKSSMKKVDNEKPSSSKRKIVISDSEDSDFVPVQSAKHNVNSVSAEEISSDDSGSKSSDSEIMPIRRKRVFNKKKGSDNDSDFEPEEKKAKKRRIVKKKSSDDSDVNSGDDDEKNKIKRKHIRKIIKTKDLDISTKTANMEEEERRKRIEERQKIYNQIYEKPDSVEVTELVLDFDDETKEPILEVDKGLLKKLKPHQVSGVKFMWDACFETVIDTLEKPGSGCILAHCMGLGKTLQVVALAHTLLSNYRKTNIERVLIISPLSTLNNWAREFRHWMSFTKKKKIEIYDMSKYKDKPTRIFKLSEWFEDGGVCILGYDMYRILANEKAKGLRKKQREILQQALVEPGPDMVVCDEGHLLKNEKTSISQAVTKMRTRRRIVLTGTPLQNNLKEYYCMIQFIKPNLLGTYKEYLNRFVNPICNGQYTDSTERDIRLMKHRSHILHKMLEGCIQRRDYSVLAPYLPPKHEYVVYTTLSDLQQQLYEYYMNTQRDLISSDISGKGARLFQDFQDLRRIWTHPMNLRVNSDTVIRKKMMTNESDSMEDFIDDNDDDHEESVASSSSSSNDSIKSFSSIVSAGGKGSSKREANGAGASGTRKTRNNPNGKESDFEELSIMPMEKDDPSEWWKKFVEEKELNNINHSPKLVILMRLLGQCEAIGDKLLVFSQSLQSIDVIEHFLSLIDSKTKGHEYEGDVGDFKGFWTPGKDYFRLDGSCSVENRENMCKQFNDTKNLRGRLFLISTRAGGLGINLVAANRVVIFDVSWNPSHDTQSIFRVYRFGQDKPCYIYRLIAIGTMEQKVYERQVAKQATAKRVIDEQQISRHYNQSDLLELYTYELKPSIPREIPILPKDRLFAELLTEHEKLLFKYHEHDSLLENEESENLSEAERKAAWSEYEAEKTRSVQTAQYISYDRNAFGSQFAGATSNKIFGFRTDVLLQLLNMKIASDHNDLNQNQVVQLVPSYLQRLYAEMNNGDPTMYKELLTLHAALVHPSGMYMNPLLYANQDNAAAGYNQTNTGMQQSGMQQPIMQQQLMQQQMQQPIMQQPIIQQPPPRFNPEEVYEID